MPCPTICIQLNIFEPLNEFTFPFKSKIWNTVLQQRHSKQIKWVVDGNYQNFSEDTKWLDKYRLTPVTHRENICLELA